MAVDFFTFGPYTYTASGNSNDMGNKDISYL